MNSFPMCEICNNSISGYDNTISGFLGVGVCAGEQRDHGAAAAHPDQDPAHRR